MWTRALLVVVLSVAGTGVVCWAQKRECVPVGDQCLLVVDFVNDTQPDAEAVCEGLGLRLVRVDTATRMQTILHHITGNGHDHGSYWVDGKKVVETFTFSDGASMEMGTPFWAASTNHTEPSGDGECVKLNKDAAFYMTSADCSERIYTLCESLPKRTSHSKATAKVQCPEAYSQVGGECLSFVHREHANWEDGETLCAMIGGHLAEIHDIEKLRDIFLHIQDAGLQNKSFWVAGCDILAEGSWRWFSGADITMGAPFWGLAQGSTLEPVTDGSKNCLGLQSPGEHYLRPVDCQALQYPLCTANPLATTLPPTDATSTTVVETTL